MHFLCQPFILYLSLFSSISLSAQFSLRFYGGGVNAPDADRVKILVDQVVNNNPGPPVDIGAEDFTLEFWMKANAADNTAGGVICGENINWIYGNIIIDRDRYNQDRKFGLSIAGGVFVFGVSGNGTGDRTICGSSNVLNGQWHHIAVQRRRSDGYMWLFVDGNLETGSDGPDGDISYPDNGVPCSNCCGGSNCNFSDPYLVLAAEKHDAGVAFPSLNGFMDELRISKNLRYSANFTPPSASFNTDLNTVGLYHFDEGMGSVLTDVSMAAEGPSNGQINYGGNPQGPVWNMDTPFSCTIATNIWDGPAAGNWHQSASHWSLNRVPESCDAVIIPAGIEVEVNSLTMAIGRTLEIQLNAAFQVTNGSVLVVGE